MNTTVLENYWKEKADVTATVQGCYEALASEAVMTRFGVWGELRSENLVAGSNVPNNINEMLKENLLPTNEICQWSSVYNVINRCNIVCHYAPEVERIDPNYTSGELKAPIAEMKTIRALCYFYLIRTFRDVPYSTAPSIDDAQNYILPATPFNTVLDSLISDLESVKDDAQRRFSVERVNGSGKIVVPNVNNSYITRWAIYALLADLYLWKGDWDNVIKYCDKVIEYKKELYDELYKKYQITSVDLFDGIPMVLDCPKGQQAEKKGGSGYNDIFGEGNSFESVFELYFDGSNSGKENRWVSSYYGNKNTKKGRLKAAEFLMSEFINEKSQIWKKKTDCRAYESIDLQDNLITKYAVEKISINTDKGNVTTQDYRGNNANWIFYRMSDILLMKAEALIERNETTDWEEAFKLINIVYKRANNVAPEATSGGLDFSEYSGSKVKMEDLVFQERHREFLFEGKRWFDLIRIARRDGNTDRLIEYAIRKYKQDINVTKIKLMDPNYIYYPYAKSELKVNPLLKQNSAYLKTEEGQLK
jgi:tetratricopeptide (TPR) repeat protein